MTTPSPGAHARLSITRAADRYLYRLESGNSRAEDSRQAAELREPAEVIQRVMAGNPNQQDLQRLGLCGGTDRIAARQNKAFLGSVGHYIHQNLLPPELAAILHDYSFASLSLAVDDSLVAIPWELANDGEDLFCMKYALSRRIPPGAAERRRPGERTGARFLLVEDPTGSLPASRDEITYLMGALLGLPGVKVRRAGMELGSREFLAALQSGNIDILHYSGHGSFDEAEPDRSHLHFRNDEPCYAWQIAEALSLSSPDLIFSNACSSARTIQGIEGLARAFLSGGAGAYIGTLWPVTDDLAGMLGAEFYRYLIHGRSPAEALRQARHNAYGKFGWTSPSWAAYLLIESDYRDAGNGADGPGR